MSIQSNRRKFLEMTGFGALVASARPALAAPIEPDMIVINAKVYTVDDAMPQAQAFAIKDGRFVAIGSTTDMRSLATPKTQTFDARGATIIPGCIDTHNHGGGERLLYDVIVGNPYEVEFVTIDSIIQKLKERAAKTPAGTWVRGYFHDDTKLRDRRSLTIADLDKVSTTHPVAVHHRGGHTAFYNSVAFRMAKITKNTPNPFGGTYDKDARGELSGRVTDTAMRVINAVGKAEVISPAEKERRQMAGVAFISQKFAQYGVTTVHHNEQNVLEAMQHQRAAGKLLHRVSYEVSGDLLEAMIKTGIETGFGDEVIRFGATTEHSADGSFSERTMAISRPYIGITPPYQGNVTESQADLNAWCERIHRAGIRPNVHANGDVAIEHCLIAYERMMRLLPRPDWRPKITHCSLLNPSLIRRMKAMDVVPAEFSTYAYYNSDKFKFYGEDLMKNMMPYRDLLDAGIKPSTGSDFSPGPFAPLMAIQGMATRTGWNGETWGANQKVSVAEAIKCSTLYGAYNSREEKDKGSITAGKLADYLILAEDPHTIEVSKIKDIKILRTVVGGRTVYQG
jgi:predicted amidohydrolase YtcJ